MSFRLATALIVVLPISSAEAKWAMPQERVPTERLIKNVERFAKAHPKDAQAQFTLGRLHSLTASGENEEQLFEPPSDAALPELPSYHRLVPTRPAPELEASELDAAIAAFDRALALDPSLRLAWLGKAWCLEQQAALKKESPREAYLAYAKAFGRAPHKTEKNGPGAAGVEAEAADALQRLSARVSEAERDPTVTQEVAAYEKELEDPHRPRARTPVVLALDGVAALAPHVDQAAHVHFDLDASHERQAWPWLKPTAALLAYDPDGCGIIHDGEQLFGSVTWWMFWSDGYRALAALDDNGDGVLSGEELRGLVVWIDHNSDGVSEPGEVTDARTWGIDRLAVEPDGLREGVPFVRRGAVLRDGRVLPSFDWTPIPSKEVPLAGR